MGPGTGLGSIGWFIGVWVTMMAAMMLPSVAPMVLVFSGIAQERARRGRTYAPTWIFVAGYFAAWTAYGLAAYGALPARRRGRSRLPRLGRTGAVRRRRRDRARRALPAHAAEGACLEHCRTPLHFVLHDWREGSLGALRMGAEHGAYCVGCCWGLMLILFSLGVMSLVWMAIVAGVIFAEKVLPFGWRLDATARGRVRRARDLGDGGAVQRARADPAGGRLGRNADGEWRSRPAGRDFPAQSAH